MVSFEKDEKLKKKNKVNKICKSSLAGAVPYIVTVKILKFGTPQTIAIIVLKIEKFDVTLH